MTNWSGNKITGFKGFAFLDAVDRSLYVSKKDCTLPHEMEVHSKEDADSERFKDELSQVISVFKSNNSFFNQRFELLVENVIQVVPKKGSQLRVNGSGVSFIQRRKDLYMSVPDKSEVCTFEFALNVAHEMGHQALITYQHYDNIIYGDHRQSVYSVIREKERPAILSFHALVATAYMLELIDSSFDKLKSLVDANYFYKRFNGLKHALLSGLNDFKHVHFTTLGKQIYAELLAFYLYLSMKKV